MSKKETIYTMLDKKKLESNPKKALSSYGSMKKMRDHNQELKNTYSYGKLQREFAKNGIINNERYLIQKIQVLRSLSKK